MKSKILFWYEARTVGNLYTTIDRWITYFGMEPIVVDLLGAFKDEPGRFPLKVESLDAAISRFSDHAWVFLDAAGSIVLDEFKHPSDPTIYAFGSDITGFGKSIDDLPGDKVKLRDPEIVTADMAIAIALHDRAMFRGGRRK